MALGRITRVFTERRTCEVKTFFGTGELDDLHIPEAQWLDTDWDEGGAETGNIPKQNSIGLVFAIDNEFFVFGFTKNQQPDGSAVSGNEPRRLTEGDKIISTNGGNRVVVKASGLVEIISKENQLQTIYYPNLGRIIEICRNFEFRAGGGKIDWQVDQALGTSLKFEEFRKDLLRSFLITEERGHVSATEIYRRKMGPGVPGLAEIPVSFFEEILSITGQYSFSITPAGLPAFKVEISPTGAYTMQIGALPQFTFQVAATGAASMDVNGIAQAEISELGDISAKNKIAEFSMSNTGDIDLKNKAANVKMAATGTLTAEGAGGKLKLDKGMVGLGSSAAELVEQVSALAKSVDDLLTALQAETHTGNLGYPTSPPVNLADYVKVQVEVKATQQLVDSIKGGV
jgi:hypothetical protein